MTLPVGRPYLDARDLARLAEPIERQWVVQGPLVEEFEAGFAARVHAPHAIACASGTAALHLGAAALDVGPGQDVLVPAFTWVATANCVEYQGATPVFVDIDLDTFNIDARHAAAAITSRTTAIIPVHLFGLPCDLDALLPLARHHALRVLEDAACGFGAAWRGRAVGTLGDIGIFSFHPRKAITTGEGGMLVTAQPALAERLRRLRAHGLHPEPSPARLGAITELGFNYRLTDLQAALGCSQLAKADEILTHRAHMAACYDEALRDVPALRRPPRDARATHGWQAYVCLVQPEGPGARAIDRAARRRDALIERLASLGIGSRPGTHAPAHLAYYAEKYRIRREDFPQAWTAERCSIALPLGAGMQPADVARVRDALVAFFGERAAA